jgi:Family of unknown function (DUF5706)
MAGDAKMADMDSDIDIDVDRAARIGAVPPVYPPNSIHLVRTLQQLTMQMSQMADQKASILMGATFLVFTITVGQAGRGQATVTLMVLAGFAFVSALLAVMAVLPRVSTKADVHDEDLPPGANLLFFGNFSRLSEDRFVALVKDRLRSDDSIVDTMLHDIHQNGKVLATRKYHYLALAYRTFIVGLTVTLGVFVWEMVVR